MAEEPGSLETLRKTAVALESTIKRRNQREWLAGAFVVAVFALFAALSSSVAERLSAALVVVSTAFVAAVLYRFGRSTLDLSEPDTMLRDSLRRELHRQARLLRLAPLWYVLPLAGSLVAFQAARGSFLSGIVLAIVLALGLTWLNLRAAAHLDGEMRKAGVDL